MPYLLDGLLPLQNAVGQAALSGVADGEHVVDAEELPLAVPQDGVEVARRLLAVDGVLAHLLLVHLEANCIKIGLPGKLILSKSKGLREVLFS